jgi:fructan beta-fructosidase
MSLKLKAISMPQRAAECNAKEKSMTEKTIKSVVSRLHTGIGLIAVLLTHALCAAPRPDIVIADFEGTDYGAWQVEGTAFGKAPARGTLPGQMHVSGFKGKGLVNSFSGGDKTTGLLTSPIFVIERKHISFLIGGGGWPGKTCINLLVDGKVVRTATGPNLKPGGSEELELASWDVADLEGRAACIQIVDNATGGWGHINIDQIVACDIPPLLPQKNVTRDLTADKRWLLLPVKNGDAKTRMELRDGAETLRFFDIELADDEPDWWAPLDLAAWTGRRLTLWAEKLPDDSRGLAAVKLSDEAFPAEGLYREPLRPQLHVSPRRGWNNDPNGLVYYNGEYHLFFQHNPYGVNWGNMHWGHAVSKDLVQWTELGEALYPDTLGPMFSGSAVVDHANTSGFGRNGRAPLVLIYTAAGNPATQCIAYSLDGRTFTKFEGNPVVTNITPGNRDPKVFWHAPTRRWIMALYVGYPEKRHTVELLASSNLREWTRLSTVEGDTGGGSYLYECPDLFELVVAGSSEKQWVLFGADGRYAVGSFDGSTFKPTTERLRGHWGSIYYAAQTFDNVPQGRRILIPWLRASSPGMPFNQCLGLPQELGLARTAEGVKLTRRPVAELTALRERTAAFGPFEAAAGTSQPLTDLRAELLELHIVCSLSPDADVMFNVLGIPLRCHAAQQELTLVTHKTTWPIKDGKLALILFVDRTCVELFSQDGLMYAPVAAIADPKLETITWTVVAGQAKAVRGSAHALRSIWP